MAQWNPQLEDEPLVDGSVPILGMNNSLPPNVIDKNLASDETNRLSALDSLNRPRPGTIARMTAGGNIDSIHHLGSGVFLYNNAGSWGKYDSRSLVNTGGLAGGPGFAKGDQVYSALCDQVLYFSRGMTLYKYTPATGLFGTNPIPSQWPTASYPIWAFSRLIYVNTNTLVVSDILSPEVWDPISQELTLDPIASDTITGQCVWQNQTIAVFRNGSTWIVETGPNLAVIDWELNRASATVGCCCHGTIVQCGVEVFFLSETGRGVYALSQMPTSNQMGVWMPISAPVKKYIDRINWSAIKCARATYWNDLYILSVPLDLATQNNFMLIYSVTLNTWQGIWCFEVAGADAGFRDSARDRTNPNKTLLLVATIDGIVSEMTYPTDRRYYDTDLSSKQTPVESILLSRSFTFTADPSQNIGGLSQIGLNQIQPHSAKLQFLESEESVDVTVIVDRTIEPLTLESVTSGALLQLTIPALPFDLDTTGYYYLPISLLSIGICSEIQIQLAGEGNWTLFQLKLAAFESAPLLTI
jgi:hypothetical protein